MELKVNLDNRYYTEEEIDEKITELTNKLEGITGFETLIVDTLPDVGVSGVLYLVLNGSSVGGDLYSEYVWVGDVFERIGSTSSTVDLSNYYTKSEVSERISEFYTSTVVPVLDTKAGLDVVTSDVDGLMSSSDKVKLDGVEEGANRVIVDSSLDGDSFNPLANSVVVTALAGKSDVGHNHDDAYYTESEMDTKLGAKSDITHNHDEEYSKLGHTHDSIYYTESEVDTKLSNKSDVGHNHDTSYSKLEHNHDDRYYTESEVDAKFDALVGFEARVVSELPALGESGVLYLILDSMGESGNIYNEYIWVESSFELIGSTETKLVVDTSLSESSVNPVENRVVYEALAGKADTGHTHTGATSSNDGFLSSTDKVKLDSVEEGANKIIVDTSLSSTSTNPVANSVVYEKLGDIETILDEIIGV